MPIAFCHLTKPVSPTVKTVSFLDYSFCILHFAFFIHSCSAVSQNAARYSYREGASPTAERVSQCSG